MDLSIEGRTKACCVRFRSQSAYARESKPLSSSAETKLAVSVRLQNILLRRRHAVRLCTVVRELN